MGWVVQSFKGVHHPRFLPGTTCHSHECLSSTWSQQKPWHWSDIDKVAGFHGDAVFNEALRKLSGQIGGFKKSSDIFSARIGSINTEDQKRPSTQKEMWIQRIARVKLNTWEMWAWHGMTYSGGAETYKLSIHWWRIGDAHQRWTFLEDNTNTKISEDCKTTAGCAGLQGVSPVTELIMTSLRYLETNLCKTCVE